MQQLLVRLMQTSYAMMWQTTYLRCPAACGKVPDASARLLFKLSLCFISLLAMQHHALQCTCLFVLTDVIFTF